MATHYYSKHPNYSVILKGGTVKFSPVTIRETGKPDHTFGRFSATDDSAERVGLKDEAELCADIEKWSGYKRKVVTKTVPPAPVVPALPLPVTPVHPAPVAPVHLAQVVPVYPVTESPVALVHPVTVAPVPPFKP